MEKEFIKCEVNFEFKDGDVMTGDRKVVCSSKIGDYIERKIAEYRQRYGEELSKAIVVSQFRNPIKVSEHCGPKSPRMRFLLFKLAFCHILTDMSA